MSELTAEKNRRAVEDAKRAEAEAKAAAEAAAKAAEEAAKAAEEAAAKAAAEAEAALQEAMRQAFAVGWWRCEQVSFVPLAWARLGSGHTKAPSCAPCAAAANLVPMRPPLFRSRRKPPPSRTRPPSP